MTEESSSEVRKMSTEAISCAWEQCIESNTRSTSVNNSH